MGSGWDRGLRCLTTIGMYVILFVGWLNYTIYVMLWLLFLVERNDICPLHLAKPWQIPLFLILPCQWVADKFCYFLSFPANELLTNSAISHPSLPMSCWQIPLFLILPCQWAADKFRYFSSFRANELLTNSAISHPSLPMSCWHIPLFLILPCQWAADDYLFTMSETIYRVIFWPTQRRVNIWTWFSNNLWFPSIVWMTSSFR